MSDGNGGEIRALRQVVREASEERAPQVDWARIERALLDQEPQARPMPRRGRRLAWWLAAAAAALAVAGASWRAARQPASPPARAVIERPGGGSLDGAALAAGDRVTAGDADLRVEHAGIAAWTLSAGGRARIALTGSLLTVELEQGSILAEVVPSARPETFAIEVGETRVAVHGTVFRVERSGDSVRVEVREGSVVVGGRTERGATRGFTLAAPSRGVFSTDGARSGEVGRDATAAVAPAPNAVPAPKPTAVAAHRAAPASVPAAEPTPASAPPAEPPERPASADVDGGVARLTAAVEKCFVSNTSVGEVSVSVSSKLTVVVDPSGAVSELRFDPPLAPAVQRCAGQAMQDLRFPQSRLGAKATRSLQLSR
jgi:ferric-dicitrate binding protein FerR (iron transport regulator)